jgi:hypothetical protein
MVSPGRNGFGTPFLAGRAGVWTTLTLSNPGSVNIPTDCFAMCRSINAANASSTHPVPSRESRGVPPPSRGACLLERRTSSTVRALRGISRVRIHRGALNAHGRRGGAAGSRYGQGNVTEALHLGAEEPFPVLRGRGVEQVFHVVIFNRPLDMARNHASKVVFRFLRRAPGFDEIELEANVRHDRQRGLYTTKDTFVTNALSIGARIAWLEAQTGVDYTTLRKHYGQWMPSEDRGELQRFAALDPTLLDPETVDLSPTKSRRGGQFPKNQRAYYVGAMREGGLEPPRGLPTRS